MDRLSKLPEELRNKIYSNVLPRFLDVQLVSVPILQSKRAVVAQVAGHANDFQAFTALITTSKQCREDAFAAFRLHTALRIDLVHALEIAPNANPAEGRRTLPTSILQRAREVVIREVYDVETREVAAWEQWMDSDMQGRRPMTWLQLQCDVHCFLQGDKINFRTGVQELKPDFTTPQPSDSDSLQAFLARLQQRQARVLRIMPTTTKFTPRVLDLLAQQVICPLDPVALIEEGDLWVGQYGQYDTIMLSRVWEAAQDEQEDKGKRSEKLKKILGLELGNTIAEALEDLP